MFSKISFPNNDDNEPYNYEKILQKLGKIDFNYCTFYITSLELLDIEMSFRDCEFYEYWSLLNYKSMQGLDDLEVYNACIFHDDVGSSGREKDRYSLEYVQFNGCTFKKKLYFENTDAKKPIFKDWKSFKSNIDYLKVENSTLNDRFIINNYIIKEVYLQDSVFNGKFEFTHSTVNIFDIDDCNFEKLAEFYGTTFSQFKIYKSIFSDYTGFEKCNFGGLNNLTKDDITKFQYVTFLSFINFRNTTFSSGLLFEDTNLKESPNFLNTEIEFSNTSRETFRIIKHSFDKLGNHIEANKYFSLEMKKYQKDLSKKRGWTQEKTIFWLNGLASNYGQSYWKATKWLLLVSFIYMLILCGFECNVFKTNLLIDVLNGWAKAVLPFGRFLPKNIEFITLVFTVIESSLIWHIVVALKRHTKR